MPRDKQAREGDDVARFAGTEDGPMLPPAGGNLGTNDRRRRKVGLLRDPERWQGILAEQEEAIAIGAPGWWPARDGKAAASRPVLPAYGSEVGAEAGEHPGGGEAAAWPAYPEPGAAAPATTQATPATPPPEASPTGSRSGG